MFCLLLSAGEGQPTLSDPVMADPAWLESSLRRSASLGLEVLERASRRTVDWTSTRASQTPVTTEEDAEIPLKVFELFLS